MTLRKIARMGHPVLAARATEISDPAEADIQSLIDDMIETLADARGLGLAAPQVYASKRVILAVDPGDGLDPATSEPLVFINPVLEPVGEERRPAVEGCLSIPGIRGIVTRFQTVRYRALDREGRTVEGEASGLLARILQHEVDHLDGVLFPERLAHAADMAFDSERAWLDKRVRSETGHAARG